MQDLQKGLILLHKEINSYNLNQQYTYQSKCYENLIQQYTYQFNQISKKFDPDSSINTYEKYIDWLSLVAMKYGEEIHVLKNVIEQILFDTFETDKEFYNILFRWYLSILKKTMKEYENFVKRVCNDILFYINNSKTNLYLIIIRVLIKRLYLYSCVYGNQPVIQEYQYLITNIEQLLK